MIYPAYLIYKAAETAATTAQLNLSRERLEEAVDNAVTFYDSVRIWNTNARIENIIPEQPVDITGNYNASQRTITLSSGTWPEWAAGQLVIAKGAYVLGTVTGNTANVVFSTSAKSQSITGKLYQFRFKLPKAKHIRMVTVTGIDQPLAPISEVQLMQALTKVYLPRPPYFYYWDSGARELIVLPQAEGTVLNVVETTSCREGRASGAAEEDHFGLIQASGTTVYGSNTRFDPLRHTGCLIYVSKDLAVPDESITVRKIVSVESSEELTVDEPLSINSPSEFRITAQIKTSEAGLQLLKACAALDIHLINQKGLDAAKTAFEYAYRAAIREDTHKTSGTILDPARIPEWIQRSSEG